MYVQRNTLASSRNHFCSGKATMYSVCCWATYHCKLYKNNKWQTQKIELSVNLYSHWNSISLHWTGLCYCVIRLRREIWWNVKVNVLGDVMPYSLVDMSTSLNQVDICLTKLHDVTCWKTVTFIFNVLRLETAKCIRMCMQGFIAFIRSNYTLQLLKLSTINVHLVVPFP